MRAEPRQRGDVRQQNGAPVGRSSFAAAAARVRLLALVEEQQRAIRPGSAARVALASQAAAADLADDVEELAAGAVDENR